MDAPDEAYSSPLPLVRDRQRRRGDIQATGLNQPFDCKRVESRQSCPFFIFCVTVMQIQQITHTLEYGTMEYGTMEYDIMEYDTHTWTGAIDGDAVGAADGVAVGADVGADVGVDVGADVGPTSYTVHSNSNEEMEKNSPSSDTTPVMRWFTKLSTISPHPYFATVQRGEGKACGWARVWDRGNRNSFLTKKKQKKERDNN